MRGAHTPASRPGSIGARTRLPAAALAALALLVGGPAAPALAQGDGRAPSSPAGDQNGVPAWLVVVASLAAGAGVSLAALGARGTLRRRREIQVARHEAAATRAPAPPPTPRPSHRPGPPPYPGPQPPARPPPSALPRRRDEGPREEPAPPSFARLVREHPRETAVIVAMAALPIGLVILVRLTAG